MALINTENKEEVKEEFDEIDEYLEENDTNTKASKIAGWGISLAVHAILILLVSMVYFAKQMLEDKPPIVIVAIDVPHPPKDDKLPRELVERPHVSNNVEHDKAVTDEVTVVLPELTIDDTIEREDVQDEDSIRCREEAKAYSEAGGEGFAMSIGIGGGGSGAWGFRKPGGDKNKMRSKYGPKNASGATSAIDAALRWLVKHQSENGMWDSDQYFTNCKDGNQCEAGKSTGGADEALTGLSCLAFLGAGYDHKHMSKYRNSVKKGLEWIIAQQQPNGLIGKRNYEHAIATMALAEAYGMTGDPSLKEAAQKAADILVERQLKDPGAADQAYAGLGWDYIEPKPSRTDISVSTWVIMGLKSSKAAGLDTKGSLEGAKVWLERTWKAANPNHAALDPYGKSVFPYTWSVDEKVQRDHTSALGSLCAVFLGHKPGEIIVDTLANDMTERWFTTNKYQTNFYHMYYATLSACMINGEHWKKWADEETGYVKWIIDTQYKTNDCFDGTFNYPKQTYHGEETSRIFNHNLALLSLEVAFRYMPLAAK